MSRANILSTPLRNEEYPQSATYAAQLVANRMRFWLGVSLIFHLLAAVFSGGFLQVDEHFQVLEFANFKLGNIAPADLPAEFRHQARPWLLSWICHWITYFMLKIGINDPFAWAGACRLFGAVLGWLSICGLAVSARDWISDRGWGRTTILALALTWYLPAFHARTSSENLSSSAFFLGLSLLVWALGRRSSGRTEPARHQAIPWIGIGALFGLSFEFRFQVVIMVFGTLLWCWVIGKARAAQLGWIILGGLAVFTLGRWIDAWGYGMLTFSPWNYFKYNLLEKRIPVSPWAELLSWEYFRKTLMESWPILSTVTFVTTFVAWVRHPTHILTWATVPFFLFHQFLHHKEIRFLYPIAAAGPVFLVLALHSQRTGRLNYEDFLASRKLRWPFLAVVALNFVSLLGSTFWPAWTPFRIYDQFYHEVASPDQARLFYLEQNPYIVSTVKFAFYQPRGLEIVPLQNGGMLQAESSRKDGAIWLFHTFHHLPEQWRNLEEICRPEFTALPAWVVQTMDRYDLRRFFPYVSNWTFYRCGEAKK